MIFVKGDKVKVKKLSKKDFEIVYKVISYSNYLLMFSDYFDKQGIITNIYLLDTGNQKIDINFNDVLLNNIYQFLSEDLIKIDI
jgi:hypothetical protein